MFQVPCFSELSPMLGWALGYSWLGFIFVYQIPVNNPNKTHQPTSRTLVIPVLWSAFTALYARCIWLCNLRKDTAVCRALILAHDHCDFGSVYCIHTTVTSAHSKLYARLTHWPTSTVTSEYTQSCVHHTSWFTFSAQVYSCPYSQRPVPGSSGHCNLKILF